MSGGLQYLDILIFALVAVFLVIRLFSVLGDRSGHEHDDQDQMFDPQSDAHRKSDRKKSQKTIQDVQDLSIDPLYSQPEEVFTEWVEEFRVYDPTFTEANFLLGATKAFEMIIKSFADEDLNTLKSLLDDDIYNTFETAIKDRQNANQKQETTIISVRSSEVERHSLEGSLATISVLFDTEQINVIKDDKGNVIDGNDNFIERVKDIWTFSRDLSSSEPIWKLIETEHAEDA